MRDLQAVLWISRSCGLGESWKKLAQAGLITDAEARAITRHEALLQMLRIRLHYIAGRREDRLLFDYQSELAKQLLSRHASKPCERTADAALLPNPRHYASSIPWCCRISRWNCFRVECGA